MKTYQSITEFNWIEPVNEEEVQKLNDLYNSLKPSIKDDDTYQFIAMDVTEDSGSFRGILNCRINDEHRQIRF
jgi:hypothetical protein